MRNVKSRLGHSADGEHTIPAMLSRLRYCGGRLRGIPYSGGDEALLQGSYAQQATVGRASFPITTASRPISSSEPELPPRLDIATRITELWDELAGFSAAQFLESRDHLLKALCDLVDAQQADWIGVVRFVSGAGNDPMRGWRPRTVSAHNHVPNSEKVMQQAFAEMDRGEPDITTTRNVELAGQYRALLL